MSKAKIKTSNKAKRNTEFEKLCSKSQQELKEMLLNKFMGNKDNVIASNGFIYRKGTFPVLLVAHMDTVHVKTPKEFIYFKETISSPTGIGGDDRCGIYMILKILQHYDCHVLFTEDEEIGGIGAELFAESELINEIYKELNYVIELDRAGSNDAVFYECDNSDFTNFITKEYWEEKVGSYTDICNICPILGLAGVNLSCGYYNPHKENEYVDIQQMENNIKEVCKLLERTTDSDVYEYVEFNYRDKWFYEDMRDTVWHIFYYSSIHNCDEEHIYEVIASTYEEAIGTFLIENPDISYSMVIDVIEG